MILKMYNKISMITVLLVTLLYVQIECQGSNNGGCKGLAVYNLTFEGKWSEDVFYKQYPLFRPNAQWSKVLGRTHSEKYTLWRLNTTATSGMKKFAELGSSEEYDKMEKQGGGGILDIFHVDPVTFGVGKTSALFFADMDHHLLSTATKVVPSPDWFVGVDSLNLCTNDRWVEFETVDLYPIDAGTDKGFTFTAPNWVEVPFRPIFQITSKFPSHPANSFFYPDMNHLPPMAALHIRRLDWYSKADAMKENHEKENEIKEDKVGATTPELENKALNDSVTKLDELLKMIKSSFDNAKIIDDENRRDIVIKIPSERKRKRNRNRRRRLRVSSKELGQSNAEYTDVTTHMHKQSTHKSKSDVTKLNVRNYTLNTNDEITSLATNSQPGIEINSITNTRQQEHNKIDINKRLHTPSVSIKVHTPTEHGTQSASNPVKSTATESKIKTVKIEKIKNAGKKIYFDVPAETSSALYKGEETSNENVNPTDEHLPREYDTADRNKMEYSDIEMFNTEPPPVELRRIWESMFPTTTHMRLNDFIHERNTFAGENDNNIETPDIGEQNEQSVNWHPINCVLSNEWAEWSPCSKTCGYGTRSRVKLIATPSQNGGKNCDQEPDLELCGTMRTCSQWRHFSFDNWGMGSKKGDHLNLKENDNVLT